MNDLKHFVTENILPLVEMPGQYIGGEWNSVVKGHADSDVKVALAFPDTYSIGMSHLGIQILYVLL
ncbi:MAG: B12-binding domain-containing radical SAM protein, partial [Planctomycetes bacterium]|nr:B12-binding domain-containing radical SAM protein [Planctomycetota bacterium]